MLATPIFLPAIDLTTSCISSQKLKLIDTSTAKEKEKING